MDKEIRYAIEYLNNMVCNYENKLCDIRMHIESLESTLDFTDNEHEKECIHIRIHELKWVLRLLQEEI